MWAPGSAAVFLAFFAWAADVCLRLQQESDDPLEIRVMASQLSWSFEHAGGSLLFQHLFWFRARPAV